MLPSHQLALEVARRLRLSSQVLDAVGQRHVAFNGYWAGSNALSGVADRAVADTQGAIVESRLP
jgi:hypothetical protein